MDSAPKTKTRPLNVHKMSADALDEFLSVDGGDTNDVARVFHELDVRRDAALPMYEALLAALDHLPEGDVRRQVKRAIALMEEPMPAATTELPPAGKRPRPDLRIVKPEGNA